MKFLFLGVVGLLVLGAVMLVRSVGATPAPPKKNPFAGKYLLVMARDSVTVTLDKAELRELGGRAFLVGKEMKESPYTRQRFGGGTVWVPVDNLTQVVELEGLDGGK
jgi:hypothetical protein